MKSMSNEDKDIQVTERNIMSNEDKDINLEKDKKYLEAGIDELEENILYKVICPICLKEKSPGALFRMMEDVWTGQRVVVHWGCLSKRRGDKHIVEVPSHMFKFEIDRLRENCRPQLELLLEKDVDFEKAKKGIKTTEEEPTKEVTQCIFEGLPPEGFDSWRSWWENVFETGKVSGIVVRRVTSKC